MELSKEQVNLCRMFFRKLLFQSDPCIDGYRTKENIVFTFTQDEAAEMKKICDGE
jgi:hypothetical protein